MIATINGDTEVNGKGHPIDVRIPDMFGSIMSATPMVNTRHFKVKAAADAFIDDYLKMEKHEADNNRKADFCFCASALAPNADAEALMHRSPTLMTTSTRVLDPSYLEPIAA
ncbi:uncharacterized protein BKA55DRAFT_686584 [Fusarium redolens]|uniref:Uncharacterized protein n=1 Tax=Fusarium redolens TaxID=48865 RepID=A0A9P9HR47_FUSRE|nr:uncharacterized protein BKA55DRAFT_686584 [Fusarium redolens]KAH7261009.1 hypothetical protein BKA55DRAFT_686584 [Fusarium redolens]